MANYALVFLGSALILLGLVGCILPVLPGPLLSFSGLFVLRFTKFIPPSSAESFDRVLWICAGVVVLVSVLDYLIPAWGAKAFGASKAGVVGAAVGLIAGLLFWPPFGIILGPFIGAVAGELLSGKDRRSSLRSGVGSFLGFLAGLALKWAASGMITWLFIRSLIAA